MPVCIDVCHLHLNKYQLLLLHTEVKDLFIPFIHSTNTYCHPLSWPEATVVERIIPDSLGVNSLLSSHVTYEETEAREGDAPKYVPFR